MMISSYSEYYGQAIGASPEVARDMVMAERNRRIANFMNDALSEGEFNTFRLSLIEQRNHLYQIYGSTTNDDIRQILLVLLQRTAEFIKLFPGVGGSLTECPCNAVKKKVCIVGGISFGPCKKNTYCNGTHYSNVMENNLCRDSSQEIVKGDSGINSTTAR